MVRPSPLAVLRLMTSSNVVGCSTGKSAGLAPLRNLASVNAGPVISICKIWSIADQAARCGELPQFENCGYRMPHRQCGDLIALHREERIRDHKGRTHFLACKIGKDGVDV